MEGATLTRLRWRLRGAWMWPAFAVLSVVDAVLLHLRPIAGSSTGLFEGLLLAVFFNLVVVAVPARMAGALWRRRRRPDLPSVVAHDYAGTTLMLLVTAAIAVGGLLHHSTVLERDRDFRAQAAAVREFVHTQTPARVRANLGRANTIRLEEDLYRTCVPGNDRRRELCLIVRTDQSPATVRRDPNNEPNTAFIRHGAYRP